MDKLARWCFRRRWIVLGLWLLVIVALNVVSASVGPEYKDDFKLPNTESKTAIDLLTSEFPQKSGDSARIVFNAREGTLDDPATRQRLEAMFAELDSLPHVEKVESLYEPGMERQVTADRKIGFVNFELDVTADKIEIDLIKDYVETAQKADSPAVQVELGGPMIQWATGEEPGGTELIAIGAAAIVLFIAFGSLFTMFTPIVTAVVAMGGFTAVIGLLTHAFSVAEFAPVLAALIGLGVGIDYSLFIVSRHRTNLLMGHSPEDSAAIAVNTSGRAVIFAGITVCIALLGLFLVGVSFLYGVALSASFAVLFTMIASITFLPALLGFLGMRALSRKDRKRLAAEGPSSTEELSKVWFRWARFVEKRSIATGALALVALLLLASPFLSLRLGSSDEGSMPKDTTNRQAYDLLATGFGPGFNGPLQLVAELNGPNDLDALANLSDVIHEVPGVAAVTPPVQSPNGKVAIVNVFPTTSPQSEDTSKLITELRKDVIPQYLEGSSLKVYVGGLTAIFDDFSEVLAGKLPLFIGAVVIVASLLLVVLFRSLLIPAIASVMNLLSVAAAFGVVVAVFQWGWLADLIGIDGTGPIEAFLPIMLFAILFGLSMDYEVFLVSRMHEEWVKTGDNEAAITLGQAETGRVITAAAAIMVMVFGSFILGGDRTIKLFGLGLSAAVLLDALIIRTILVPAVMHWCGKANWWLPSWLDRRLPHFSMEAPPQSPGVASAVAPAEQR